MKSNDHLCRFKTEIALKINEKKDYYPCCNEDLSMETSKFL